ncbi:putative tail fiber protein [Mesorhizobium phage Cp1R7A-A1]|nr:putative tail fiber protein [Mesorhizobium phage Cp1R7A-A1]
MIILGIVANQQNGGTYGTPPPISADWRVLVSETASGAPGTTVFVNKLEWLDAAGSVISVATADHSANASDGSHVPQACFDEDDTSYWAGLRDTGTLYGVNAWIQTTWEDAVEVRGVKLQASWDNMDGCPGEFSIQYKTPGGAWLTLFKVISQVGWDAQELRSFHLGGRVWRLVVNSTEEGTKVAIGEIEFRSVANVSERHNDDGGQPLASDQVLPESRFNAFDNDPSTVWSADALPASIEYWFQTTKPVEQVALFAVADRLDQQALTTQLFYSDDYSATWIEAGSVPVLSVSGGYGYGYGYFYGGS